MVGILLLLTLTLGVPYFVLSATGPLLQTWFSLAHPGRSPYRLYALSNAGSLLALITYPFYFEWAFTRQTQSLLWSGGLLVFALVCGWAAWSIRSLEPALEQTREPAGEGVQASPAVPFADRLFWVVFPAIASILLLATTNQLSQDIAVIPFLWVLPLSLYLLTFILCFDHPRWYRRGPFAALLVIGTAVVCHLLFVESNAPLWLQVSGYAGTLFVGCMICHGELYRLKPPPRQLTSYYLLISAGGALGGLLVAVVAPSLLDRTAELQAGLWLLSYMIGMVALKDRSRSLALGAGVGAAAVILLVPMFYLSATSDVLEWCSRYWDSAVVTYRPHWKLIGIGLALGALCLTRPQGAPRGGWRPRMAGLVMLLCVALGMVLIVQLNRSARAALVATRNFYGTLKVYEDLSHNENGHHLKLVHGVITHGMQFLNKDQSVWPSSYYGESSGVGLAIKHLRRKAGERHIGLVGLGTGTLATYGRAGDSLRIYEINPAVERIARSYFTYLADSAATVEVVLGDARLSLEQERDRGQPQAFDLLVLDAFSSDAIPIHLLTRESMELYLHHLRTHGVIAVHISNRYLDLQPVVEKLAQHFKLKALTIVEDDSDSWWVYNTTWMLLAREHEALEVDELYDHLRAPSLKTDKIDLWTDDHAALFPILR
ncbi:MAG: fused MFS/spermidine synthase [Opitutaceae bacterium]|nr:fused MFS/spermidine synthase [Opitutaceae bacterium]